MCAAGREAQEAPHAGRPVPRREADGRLHQQGREALHHGHRRGQEGQGRQEGERRARFESFITRSSGITTCMMAITGGRGRLTRRREGKESHHGNVRILAATTDSRNAVRVSSYVLQGVKGRKP